MQTDRSTRLRLFCYWQESCVQFSLVKSQFQFMYIHQGSVPYLSSVHFLCTNTSASCICELGKINIGIIIIRLILLKPITKKYHLKWNGCFYIYIDGIQIDTVDNTQFMWVVTDNNQMEWTYRICTWSKPKSIGILLKSRPRLIK